MRRFAVTMMAAALAATASPCEAALAVRKTVVAKNVPAWAREAAARPIPETEAAAVILHDEMIVEPQVDHGVRVTSRLVVKILKREALDRFGSYVGRYRKDDRVLSLRAWTFLADGTIRIPDPKIDVRETPYISAGTVFEDSWIKELDAPSGSTGAIIGYEFVRLLDLDLGAESFVFGDVAYPIVFSRASLSAPPGWETAWVQTGDDGATCVRTDGGIACEAKNLTPPAVEPSRPPLRDVLPGCWLRWWSPDGGRGFRDWNAVGAWAETLTGPVLKEVGEVPRTASRLKPADPSDLLRAIGRAFDYAARDVRYVSVQLGIGGYRPHPPALVAQRRFGDCKDKAFLLRAIVQEWGKPTYFLLVSTRDYHAVDPDVPTPAQFNHAIAAVPLPDGVGTDLWSTIRVEGLGRLLILDATAREGPAWDLSGGVQGTVGLLVHPGGGTLVHLPVQPPEAGRIASTLRAAIDESGSLVEATLVDSWSGSLAADVRGWFATSAEDERRRELQEDIQHGFPGGELGPHTFSGLDRSDANVRREAMVRGGLFGRRAGPMLIVQPGRISTYVVDGGLPPPPRAHDFVLDDPRTETIDAEVVVPKGWRPESLPDAFTLDTPELTARATWAIEDGRLRYRREARVLATRVPPDRYPAFRDAAMRVNGADMYGVVFVRGD